MVYFDWNATAPLLPEAREAWLEAAETGWANPSTPYRAGARARLQLDEARERMAALLGVEAGRVIFTSGATEANNGILREALRRAPAGSGIWVSAVEHPSILETARELFGERLREIPVDAGGRIDLEWLEENLRSAPPVLVSVIAASNETGVVQPWETAYRLCRENGVAFHCDAVQWFGKTGGVAAVEGRPAMTVSAHKLGGPKGVGALVIDPSWKGLKLQSGGAQELDTRAGTEDIPAIRAMVAAFEKRLGDPLPGAVQAGRDRFEAGLRNHWGRRVRIHGEGAWRLGNTSSVCLPDYRSGRWILQLDRRGFAVSSGSACSTAKDDPSTVLRAMGVGTGEIGRTIRFSGGWETTGEDWDALLRAVLDTHRELSEAESGGGPARVIEI
jgi:cysteine desulfurase